MCCQLTHILGCGSSRVRPRLGHTKYFKNGRNGCPSWRSGMRGYLYDLLTRLNRNVSFNRDRLYLLLCCFQSCLLQLCCMWEGVTSVTHLVTSLTISVVKWYSIRLGAGGRRFDPRPGHTQCFKMVVMSSLGSLAVRFVWLAFQLIGLCPDKSSSSRPYW